MCNSRYSTENDYLCRMEIKELTSLTEAQVADLLNLMAVLDDTVAVTPEMLRAAAEAPETHLFAAVEGGHIVGCASLCITRHPLGLKGGVEDVVVSPACRGMGLGRKLMEHIIGYARGLAPIELHLTSRPSRVAANQLYVSLGFQPHQTNVYKMPVLSSGPGLA